LAPSWPSGPCDPPDFFADWDFSDDSLDDSEEELDWGIWGFVGGWGIWGVGGRGTLGRELFCWLAQPAAERPRATMATTVSLRIPRPAFMRPLPPDAST
jgi:hypothetical protein